MSNIEVNEGLYWRETAVICIEYAIEVEEVYGSTVQFELNPITLVDL